MAPVVGAVPELARAAHAERNLKRMNPTTRALEPAFFLRCFFVFVLGCSFLINAICRAASYQETSPPRG